ncbi:SHC-transforming protein 1 [Trichonephila clavipes]|nr:SHC-transforming protein 1 [Trichonephila clavipes]
MTSLRHTQRPNRETSHSKGGNYPSPVAEPFAASLTSIQTESTNPLDTLIGSISNSTTLTTSSSIQSDRPISKAESERAVLLKEPWFHGAISRQESEALVVKDGDFLVRESQNTPGQYVLTGMQNLLRKHLLLVDPEGVIRTKDHVFESVSHLIKHHRDNCLPIISAESALLLRTPVHRVRSSASKPVQVIQAQYEQLSEFERGRIIGLKEAGWANRRMGQSVAAIRRCWQQ